MSKGIYYFTDKKNSMVVYIGRFSQRQRIKDHYQPSRYNEQVFNRVLQNNPYRYEYGIIYEYSDLTNDELNYLEMKEIMKHKYLHDEIPRHNFTVGGEGSTGYRHTKEAIQKISEATKGENNPYYGQYGSNHSKWKSYIRITKYGKQNDKQRYALRKDGKVVKISIDIHKLISFSFENFPNEKLHIEVNK